MTDTKSLNSDLTHLLEVKDLHISFFMDNHEVKAVNGVSYFVDENEIVAIVGESGCGKSVTQMSILQLIQTPPGKIMGGEILYNGENLLKRSQKEMRSIRGGEIAMIFQEPMTSLNPVFTIGQQLSEVIQTHKKVSKKEAWQIGIKALSDVGIPDPKERMNSYPFEMSGGMRQRAMISIAVACQSKIIIADEPTTALDVTTQAQVMELLLSIMENLGTSIVLVTHNLGLVTRYANRVYVMYAGSIVESGTTEQVLTAAYHPYSQGLLKSVPRLDNDKNEDLIPIHGAPPSLAHLSDYCAFFPRCPFAIPACKTSPIPELKKIGEGNHYAACHRDFEEQV